MLHVLKTSAEAFCDKLSDGLCLCMSAGYQRPVLQTFLTSKISSELRWFSCVRVCESV